MTPRLTQLMAGVMAGDPRVRQRVLLPTGAGALLVAGFGYGPLHSAALFAVGFVAAVIVLLAMGVTLLLEMRYATAETPEFSDVSTASARRDVS